MTAWNPPLITHNDPFSASVIDGAFDDLASWSGGIGDHQSGHSNIRNNRSIPATKFSSGTTSKVWRNNYTGYNTYLLWSKGATSGPTSSAFTDPVTQGKVYDIPGSSINFYLRRAVPANRLIMESSIHFWQAREGNYFQQTTNGHSEAIFEVILTGYLDGVALSSLSSRNTRCRYAINPTASTNKNSFSRRGFDGSFWGVAASTVEAGLHTFKVTMTFNTYRTLVGTVNDKWMLNHIKGGPPNTSVTAIYI